MIFYNHLNILRKLLIIKRFDAMVLDLFRIAYIKNFIITVTMWWKRNLESERNSVLRKKNKSNHSIWDVLNFLLMLLFYWKTLSYSITNLIKCLSWDFYWCLQYHITSILVIDMFHLRRLLSTTDLY